MICSPRTVLAPPEQKKQKHFGGQSSEIVIGLRGQAGLRYSVQDLRLATGPNARSLQAGRVAQKHGVADQEPSSFLCEVLRLYRAQLIPADSLQGHHKPQEKHQD